MTEKNKHNLNDLTNHHLNSMEVHTLVSNLNRIELEKEIRKNPPAITYVFDLLLGIAGLPVIGYMLWSSLASADNVWAVLFILGFFGKGQT